MRALGWTAPLAVGLLLAASGGGRAQAPGAVAELPDPPLVEPAAEPAAQTVEQPVVEPVAPPAAEPAAEPVEAAPVEPDSLIESGDYAQPKAKRQCSTADVLRGVCTSEEAAQASARKSWRLLGRIEYVVPVVWDDSVENDMLLYYYLGAEVDLPFVLPGLYAAAWVGLSQKFWRIAGESPVDFEDPLLALGYRHNFAVGGTHDLIVISRVGAYFPASRPSRNNLHYTTLDWVTSARYPFEVADLGLFTVGANLWTQLAFREYDTQSGEAISADFDTPGGSNTVFRLEGAGVLQYTIFDQPSAGSLLAEASAGYRHRFRYDGSAEPDWYWSLGATYTPISYLSVGLAMEHGYSDVLRGGVAHLVAFDRDETVWRAAVYGRY